MVLGKTFPCIQSLEKKPESRRSSRAGEGGSGLAPNQLTSGNKDGGGVSSFECASSAESGVVGTGLLPSRWMLAAMWSWVQWGLRGRSDGGEV